MSGDIDKGKLALEEDALDLEKEDFEANIRFEPLRNPYVFNLNTEFLKFWAAIGLGLIIIGYISESSFTTVGFPGTSSDKDINLVLFVFVYVLVTVIIVSSNNFRSNLMLKNDLKQYEDQRYWSNGNGEFQNKSKYDVLLEEFDDHAFLELKPNIGHKLLTMIISILGGAWLLIVPIFFPEILFKSLFGVSEFVWILGAITLFFVQVAVFYRSRTKTNTFLLEFGNEFPFIYNRSSVAVGIAEESELYLIKKEWKYYTNQGPKYLIWYSIRLFPYMDMYLKQVKTKYAFLLDYPTEVSEDNLWELYTLGTVLSYYFEIPFNRTPIKYADISEKLL